jgi:hypothetical protein
MKAIAIIAAVINAIGNPLNALGVLADSNLTLMQLKVTIISRKPTEVPIPHPNDSRNVKP